MKLLLLVLSFVSAFAADSFKLIKSNDVVIGSKSGTLRLYDANNEKTRIREGVVHGATMLPSSSSYDLAVLPSDKNAKLVFYCANERCMASHTAAKRAADAGYKDVSVMSDGIEGWKKSGQGTSPFLQGR